MSRDQPFTLRPFLPSEHPPPAISLAGEASRTGATLSLTYRLSGQLALLKLAPPAPAPQRRSGLWRESCLEFFLAPVEGQYYWEGNFSPAGHWNLYRFRGYRQGMAEEGGVPAIPVRWHSTSHLLELALTLDLSALLKPEQPCRLGISAVIQTSGGSLSHWALAHPARQPDFHHPAGFCLNC